MEYLKKNYKILSQQELIEIIKASKQYDENFLLITFDDGLKEQMQAYKILTDMGLCAVFYVPTDPIEDNTCLSVHKIHYIRSILDDNDLYKKMDDEFGIESYSFDRNVLEAQYKYDNQLSRKVKYYLNFVLDENQRNLFINTLFSALVHDEANFASNLYMSDNDVKELSLKGMLGTHSASHKPLSKLSDEMIYADIDKSMKFFKKIDIENIPSISYPYGGKSAVDNRVINQVNKFDFEFGLTMYRGTNDQEYLSSNKMLLRRISCSDLFK